jgi:hypothetical protein
MYFYPYYNIKKLNLKILDQKEDRFYTIEKISIGRIITEKQVELVGSFVIEVKDKQYEITISKSEGNVQFLSFSLKDHFIKWLMFVKAINNLQKKSSAS